MTRLTNDKINAVVLDVIKNSGATDYDRISRDTICYRVFGRVTENTRRIVRDAVKELRGMGEPIIADSGKAGYYYDETKIDAIIADYESRIISMSQTVRALRRGNKHDAVQMELIELC
jgi:hypothetical protein